MCSEWGFWDAFWRRISHSGRVCFESGSHVRADLLLSCPLPYPLIRYTLGESSRSWGPNETTQDSLRSANEPSPNTSIRDTLGVTPRPTHTTARAHFAHYGAMLLSFPWFSSEFCLGGSSVITSWQCHSEGCWPFNSIRERSDAIIILRLTLMSVNHILLQPTLIVWFTTLIKLSW